MACGAGPENCTQIGRICCSIAEFDNDAKDLERGMFDNNRQRDEGAVLLAHGNHVAFGAAGDPTFAKLVPITAFVELTVAPPIMLI